MQEARGIVPFIVFGFLICVSQNAVASSSCRGTLQQFSEVAGILWTPQEVKSIFDSIESAWAADTSSDAANWTDANPAYGHCAVTALLVQDFFGGQIVNASWPGEAGIKISHYWNRFCHSELDLTRSQFSAATTIPQGQEKQGNFASTREYVLSHEATVNRYRELRDRVVSALQRRNLQRPFFSELIRGPLPATVRAFDLDGTVLKLSTPIFLFPKRGGEPVEILGADYAQLVSQVGVSGPYQEFEIRRNPRNKGSFALYGSVGDTENYFLRYLRNAVESGGDAWKGPYWNQLRQSLRSYETARYTFVITARGHRPEHIHEGFQYLKAQGIIPFVPPVENIFPVGDLSGRSQGYDRREAKADALETLLKQLSFRWRLRLSLLDSPAKIDFHSYEDEKPILEMMKRRFGEGVNWRWPMMRGEFHGVH